MNFQKSRITDIKKKKNNNKIIKKTHTSTNNKFYMKINLNKKIDTS